MALQTRDRQQEEADLQRGRAAFYQDHAGELTQAVTEGKVPAQYSPFYVRGFKNAQGSAAGDKLRSDFQSWWDSWEGKDSDDPEAFTKGFQQFIQGKLGTNDPDVLAGLVPHVEALQANATTQYTQYRHDRTVNGSLTAHGAVISSSVQTGLDDGLVSDKGADYSAIFGNVDRVVAESLAKGDPGGKAVDTFIDVMSSKILATKDPKLLDWFGRKVPGKDYTYGDTPHGLEVKNATLNALEVYAGKVRNEMGEQQRAEQKRLRDEAEAGIIDGLIKDPNAPLDDKLLAQARKNGNPKIQVDAVGWRDALTKAKPSDPQEVQAFYSRIIAGEVEPDAAMKQALSHGVFSSPEDLRAAVSFIQSYKGKQATMEKAAGSQVYRDVLEAIKGRTSAKDPLSLNPIAGGLSNEGFEATNDFRELVARWIIEHPDAPQMDIEAQVQKLGQQITSRIGGNEENPLAPQTYERDPNLPFSNPWTDAGNASKQQDPDADIREWERANDIKPEQKAKLEDQAAQSGMVYEEYLRSRVIKPQPQASQAPDAGLKADPISYTPDATADPDANDQPGTRLTPQRAGELVDAAFSSAGTAGQSPSGGEAGLLNLIRNEEAGGNYNAVFGNPGNQRDLSEFSVDQILEFQREAQRRGYASTAIGGYQLLHKTLKGLKAEMGLSGSEKFTPELQDRMGMALLNRRGLQAFRSGRISKGQFALSLSQEFAALPNPNTGRSFYHGDGLNASKVPASTVYAALGFEPVAYRAPTSASPSGIGGDLSFNHPGQEKGVRQQLKAAVIGVGMEMGRDFTVMSGYRSPNHPAERGKASGGGEHTHGNAMDLDMAGLDDRQRAELVQRLASRGVKRFITYSKYPNMLHIDVKDQSGDGKPYFMHDKSARNISRAPAWFRALAGVDNI